MKKGTIKAILVDDEHSAIQILSSLLERIDADIEIVAKCSNLVMAVEAIKEHKPDLVFLDIEMPKFAGYEITSFFDTVNFDIIFVTAYDHYAIKAFEVSAVDYILKPIQVPRLQEAIDKYTQKVHDSAAALNYKIMMESLTTNAISKLVVPTAKGQKVLLVPDIVSIEASRAYCTIHTQDGQAYIISKNLKHFESLLEENQSFVRCHKSWMVNTDYIETYSKTDLSIKLTNGQTAKLSKYKKAEFEEVIAR